MTQPTRTTPRRDVGVITVSYCKNCNHRWQGSNAAYDAIAHHEQTGHNIRVEQTIFWERKAVGSLQSAVGSSVPATTT